MHAKRDVDFGIKLSRTGRILFCPAARLGHFHDPVGRVSASVAAEDDLFNRFFVLRNTVQMGFPRAFALVSIYFIIESGSTFIGSIRRLQFGDFFERLHGRLKAMSRILWTISASPRPFAH